MHRGGREGRHTGAVEPTDVATGPGCGCTGAGHMAGLAGVVQSQWGCPWLGRGRHTRSCHHHRHCYEHILINLASVRVKEAIHMGGCRMRL